MPKKIPKEIQDAARTMMLSDAAAHVKQGKSIARLAWKGDRVVYKSGRHRRGGFEECYRNVLRRAFHPTIDDCMAADWFVVEEEKEGKK